MKIKFNTNRAANIIIGTIVVFIGLFLFLYLPKGKTVSSVTKIGTYNSWPANLKPIDPDIDQRLPHMTYARLTDSIKLMRSLRDGDEPFGQEIMFGMIGIRSGRVCDTCSYQSYWQLKPGWGHKQSYISLRGWTLNTRNELWHIDEGKFYVSHGQGYVRQAIIDTVIKKADGSVNNRILLKDVPVKFRYSHRENYLLIPVSNTLGSILNVVFIVLIVVGIAYTLFLFSAFLRFTFDVSKGEIFTAKNVSRLKLITISLLCFPLLIYGLNYAMKLVFYSYFIPGVIVKYDALPNLWTNLVLVIIFLLLYKAFYQGKKLKEEQDLTI